MTENVRVVGRLALMYNKYSSLYCKTKLSRINTQNKMAFSTFKYQVL